MNGMRFNQDPDRLELVICENSDWLLFDNVAGVLQRELHGSWSAKLDGLDQRYWDLKIGTAMLTLHLEHYLGVMLFPAAGTSDKATSKTLLERAYEILTVYEPDF